MSEKKDENSGRSEPSEEAVKNLYRYLLKTSVRRYLEKQKRENKSLDED